MMMVSIDLYMTFNELPSELQQHQEQLPSAVPDAGNGR
jgi:hypothetical protein